MDKETDSSGKQPVPTSMTLDTTDKETQPSGSQPVPASMTLNSIDKETRPSGAQPVSTPMRLDSMDKETRPSGLRPASTFETLGSVDKETRPSGIRPAPALVTPGSMDKETHPSGIQPAPTLRAFDLIDTDTRNSGTQLGPALLPVHSDAQTERARKKMMRKITWKRRLNHFTWAWYTLAMSTGGLALLIDGQHYKFPFEEHVGLAIFALYFIIMLILCSAMALRFITHGGFGNSIKHAREGLFFPTFFLAVAVGISGAQRYLAPHHRGLFQGTIMILFWLYVATTFALAIGQYSFLFEYHNYGLQTMMPTWILPIFPIMLSGTIAANIAPTQSSSRAISMIIAGFTAQILGFAVSMLMYSHMLGRLMQSGLPDREHRPGLFMNVGPPSFTALAFIGLSNSIPMQFDYAYGGTYDISSIRTAGVVMAVAVWALAFFWLCIAAVAVCRSRPKFFRLGWWAMVFPNTGFVLASIAIAKSIENAICLWITTGLSAVILVVYYHVAINCYKAVRRGDIMYPGRDEDVDH
ncbi:voltage-dependent anion channel-domain-containing protein [Nemania sp. FL0916]|nr:voltage-dependent anion channel-domain-containing protein [Nemania sp. FL0916]